MVLQITSHAATTAPHRFANRVCARRRHHLHRHVVLVLDVLRDLMDLGAYLPVREVLQGHGDLDEAGLGIGPA
jgi:hypothetical protein